MNKKFLARCEELSKDIEKSYEEGVTLEEAEKLAGKFLHAQIEVSEELVKFDLDARMRKSGVKAIRAAVYLDGVKSADKKPSDVMLEAMINSSPLVEEIQNGFDEAEVKRDQLDRYYSIFKEAHIHFRSIAKGRFE